VVLLTIFRLRLRKRLLHQRRLLLRLGGTLRQDRPRTISASAEGELPAWAGGAAPARAANPRNR